MTDDVYNQKETIHLALVPDGNRRYAIKNNKPVWSGHWSGAKKIKKFLEWCTNYPQIKRISIFALSTENIERDKREVDELWEVYKREFDKMIHSPQLKKYQVKVNIVGNRDVWRSDVSRAAKDVMMATASYSRVVLNIMLAYGSKSEMINAIQKIIGKGLRKFQVTEDLLDEYLLISQPVDLIIRTGDQYRLSNFLLYQSAYAEIYFSKTLWPEFTRREFDWIMKWYFNQKKKFGR